MGDMAELYDYDLDWEDFQDPDRIITCRYCGRSGFHWSVTDHGWRLLNSKGGVHTCPEYQETKHKAEGRENDNDER